MWCLFHFAVDSIRIRMSVKVIRYILPRAFNRPISNVAVMNRTTTVVCNKVWKKGAEYLPQYAGVPISLAAPAGPSHGHPFNTHWHMRASSIRSWALVDQWYFGFGTIHALNAYHCKFNWGKYCNTCIWCSFGYKYFYRRAVGFKIAALVIMLI